MKKFPKAIKYLLALLALIVLALPGKVQAQATMQDYCITPPLIGVPTKPNLLMMLDNSASMFDLSYVDRGKFTGTCSVTTAQACSDTVNCPSGETCKNITFTRVPTYCYDQTYKSTNTYAGYFDSDVFYQYDATSKDFYEILTFPADASCASPSTLKKITNPANTLFVCYTAVSPRDVTLFAAKGNYLNWLTASKFDQQKQILTGGKYVSKVCSNAVDTSCVADSDCPLVPTGGVCTIDPSDFLQSESRGCVGRGFIKEALTADFVNYTDVSINPNTSLGITFSINGPVDATNSSAPSPGGQTSIGVLVGDYNQELCQEAIVLLSEGGSLGSIKSALTDCLTFTMEAGAYCNLYPSLSCTKDSDCIFDTGLCSIINDGACNVVTGGVCGVKTPGVCTAYTSPTCSCVGDKCTKICSNAGPLNGTTCLNASKCVTSGCTAGDPALLNTVCTTNASCDDKWCTAGRVGADCLTSTDCNPSACVGGPRNGLICANNIECNSSNCVAPSHASKIGSLCATNVDCNANVGPCISGNATTVSKTKVVFNQSMQSCWAYNGGVPPFTDIGIDEVKTIYNQCPDIYDENYICLGGDRDSLNCNADADCTGGGYCENGPIAIQPGNPAYLCSRNYTGFCATTSDEWVHTGWIANGYPSAEDCIKQKYRDFCSIMTAPEVIDPTDAPSVTTTYDNLPAIISDIGVEAQLGQPLKNLKARVRAATPPTNLIQQFRDLIRMGAMTFNFNGSISECSSVSPLPPGTVPCPKICSTDATKTCGSPFDCPSPATATCDVTSNNFDGSRIAHYIGKGKCSVSTSTECTTAANCPSGEKCVSDGVGDHTTGLIRAIDDIRGSTWTPFTEAFYNAIGYMATDRRCSNSSTTLCTRDTDCPTGGICPASTGLSRTDLRINSADFVNQLNPSEYMCQKNNILLITDGMSTTDLNLSIKPVVDTYFSTSTDPYATCADYAGSENLDNLAWLAKNRNINTFSKTTASPANAAPRSNDYINTHVVFTGATSNAIGDCNAETLLTNTATKGGTTLRKAENPDQLKTQLESALWDISAGATSGTAASVLASGEGSGANLIQAVFYPTKKFTNSATGNFDEITWSGRLTNLWYYVDPFFGNSSIREDDGVVVGSSKVFDLKTTTDRKDYVSQMYYDTLTETVNAKRFTDPEGDGAPNTQLTPDISIENIPSLWEAGTLLWKRDLATSPRTIYTTIDGVTRMEFKTANAGTLTSFLTATDNTEASNIISYVTGSDVSGYRSRTVKVDLNGDGDTLDTDVGGFNETTARVWKLGDILNSTPKISSWQPLNSYNMAPYGDSSYGYPYQETSLEDAPNANRFTTTSSYKDRGMVFVGGNDGMLHAFKLGKLELKWGGQSRTEIAKLTGTDLGKEMWSFIPKNALPYLKHMADPNYCHLYYVDLTPFIFDASIGAGAGDESAAPRTAGSWRTILIGGMRYGGACKNSSTTCTDVDGDGQKDCVNTPADGLGYSSYFALDITDQNDPKLLWEYSHEEMGFSTAGPVVLRMKARSGATELPNANGKWFVVLASGSTGPIDTVNRQFMGRSDQELKLFVLDLKTGPASPVVIIPTGITNAFAGNMLGTVLDTDLDYQDDVVYIPYVKRAGAGIVADPYTWTDGGVGRLITRESPNTSDWDFSKVMDGIGPVTAAVSKLVDPKTNTLWLYFGTGRYFFEKSGGADDASGQRHIFGIKDPCYSASGLDTDCTTERTFGSLTDKTCSGLTGSALTACLDASVSYGWFIRLAPAGAYTLAPEASRLYNAQRSTIDPVSSNRGFVIFATFKPYDDDCALTGRSSIWAVKYDTGGSAGMLMGDLIIQTSAGLIDNISPSPVERELFISSAGAIGGKPELMSLRSAVNKTVHIKER